MNTIINTNFIRSIEVFKKVKAPNYKYKNQHRFCFIKRPAGIYRFVCELGFHVYISDEQYNHVFVDDGIVYFRPQIEVYYSKTEYDVIYFDSDNELDKYVEHIKTIINHIEY